MNYENSIANRGNLYRMKKLMKRAENGEKLVIGFIGGSITQGSVSTKPENCYAYRVYSWWKENFPKSEFIYVNAGIGGTTSQFGVARVQEDLLDHEPDLVVAEFSVNDESTEHFRETYEGLIRKIYCSPKLPAVLIVNNVYYNNGANAQLQHAKVGRYYQIPCVSMQSTIYQEVVAGRIENRDITPDDLHPNDIGHEMVAAVIRYFLQKVYEELNEKEIEVSYPEPLTANSYENSVRLRNMDCDPVLKGFEEDHAQQNGIADCFKNGWQASRKGDAIEFEVEGSGISIQYRKSVAKPAPIARVIIDGDIENSRLLDANFDETWGDKLEIDTISEHTENKKHTVRIEITEADEVVVPFYLASVIVAQ